MAARRRFDKEDTGMKSMLGSMAVAFMFCAAPASAAETGQAEYDTYYVYDTVAKIDSGAGSGAIVDVTGINRNVKGEGPFNDMSVGCLEHQSLVGEHSTSTVAALKPIKMATTFSRRSTPRPTISWTAAR